MWGMLVREWSPAADAPCVYSLSLLHVSVCVFSARWRSVAVGKGRCSNWTPHVQPPAEVLAEATVIKVTLLWTYCRRAHSQRCRVASWHWCWRSVKVASKCFSDRHGHTNTSTLLVTRRRERRILLLIMQRMDLYTFFFKTPALMYFLSFSLEHGTLSPGKKYTAAGVD